jgi:NADH-quinone oxidoreductase subunit C
MKTPEEVYNILKNEFGEEVILSYDDSLPVDPIISVDPLKINVVGKFLRDNEELLFDSLMLLSGVDDFNAKKVKDEDGNVKEEGRTLSVYYHLHSMKLDHKVVIKVSTPIEEPKIESVEHVWRTADWHEREAYDMYGIIFLNHHDLRRILMPDDWGDRWPLRKDYEDPEYYNGMKVPY